MTYAPAVGDTVRLIGDPQQRDWKVDWIGKREFAILSDDATLRVEPWQVEKVEPSEPPEPPVGGVVRVGRHVYLRRADGWYGPRGPLAWVSIQSFCNSNNKWVVLVDPSDEDALRAAGLCRVEDVSNYLLTRYPKEIIWQEFYEKFGGAK